MLACLHQKEKNITANGESLEVMGKTIADFEFEHFQCPNIAVIANII